MKNDTIFTPELRKLSLGLIRLSPDLKIIDKNKASENILELPSRGVNFLKLCADDQSLERLKGLVKKYGAFGIVSVLAGNRTLSAAVFRERDGNILIVLHPMLTAIDAAANKERAESVLGQYSKQILDALTSEDEIYELFPDESERAGMSLQKKVWGASEIYFNLNIKNICPLEHAVNKIIEKLENTDLKKSFTFIIDKSVRSFGLFIEMSRLLYVLTEMMDAAAVIAPDGVCTVRITADTDILNITLIDRSKLKNARLRDIRIKILSVVFSLLGVDINKRLENNGHIILSATVPLEKQPYRLREPEIGEELVSYLSFSLAFYGLLLREQ